MTYVGNLPRTCVKETGEVIMRILMPARLNVCGRVVFLCVCMCVCGGLEDLGDGGGRRAHVVWFSGHAEEAARQTLGLAVEGDELQQRGGADGGDACMMGKHSLTGIGHQTRRRTSHNENTLMHT